MDRPIETLMQEHRVIEQVMACLKTMTQRAESHGTLDTLSACEAIYFFRRFGDGYHCFKEEERLVPMMTARGFSPNHGPLADMVSEHRHGRELLSAMEQAVNDFEQNQTDALRRFMKNARRYLAMLHEHIQMEDRCLFPMVNQVLSDSEQQALADSFCHCENGEMGTADREQYLQIANRLAERYGVVKRTKHYATSAALREQV